MAVDTVHPLYEFHEQRAQRTRDAVEGADMIKYRDRVYLPDPSGDITKLKEPEKSDAIARYKTYKQRALWLGVTGRTHDGMVGAVFRKDPSIDLPSVIGYMANDADGNGMGIDGVSRLVVSGLLREGRQGLLVDYPEAEDGLTREQTAGLRAAIRIYTSENIFNWYRRGDQISLVVLRETYEIGDDEFTHDWDYQYRVLTLDSKGLYVQRVFRGGAEVARVEPRRADGSRWPFIPFMFAGARNNDEHPDKPLLLDMADINIAHYRNSADQEESAFIAGQPMIHVDTGDSTTEDFRDHNPEIRLGVQQGVVTKGGSIEMVQAESRNIYNELMEHKEKQMLSIGARLIEQSNGPQTAEEVRAKSATENATLSTVRDNANDAMNQALAWALQYMDMRVSSDDIEYDLNRQFYPEQADPQEVMARIQELDRGLIAKKDYRDWRRRTGGISPERTDEEIDEEVQAGGAIL